MMTTKNWAELLDRASAQVFVGRRREREAFDAFLGDDTLRLLHVHGPAGIGKTALLDRLKGRADSGMWQTHWVDAAAIEPTATSIEQAFDERRTCQHGCRESTRSDPVYGPWNSITCAVERGSHCSSFTD